MRFRPTLLALAVFLTACGSSSSPKAQPTSASALGRVVTIPPLPTPSRLKLIKHHGKGSQALNGKHTLTGKRGTRPVPAARPVHVPPPTPFPASAYTAVLQGLVTDARSRKALPGVKIAVGTTSPHVALTGPKGRYRLAFPARSMVPVEVTKRGYMGQLYMGALKVRQTYTLNFQLTRIVPGHPAPPSPPGIFGQG